MFVLTALTLMSDPAHAVTQEEIQKSYTEFLTAEGHKSWIDNDGDVQFTWKDKNVFIETNEEDPFFFRMAMFNIWPIESTQESIQVWAACDAVNREIKVIKCHTQSDNVWLSAESQLPKWEDYKAIFGKLMDHMDAALSKFVEEM